MDLLSMLMNAKIRDMDGDEIGEVIEVQICGGKLEIMMDLISVDLEDEEDPDDGAKDDIPENDASKQEFPKLAAMGKRVTKDGTNG